MARGGSRGRRTNYVRDNSGRFASTPGGGPPKRSTPATRRAAMRKARPTVTGGTLGARGSLRRSRAKLAGKNPADRSLQGSLSLRAQKGAVTRGANRLGKVRAASTVQMAARVGVIRKGGAVSQLRGRVTTAKPVVTAKPSTPARKPAALKWEKPAGSVGRQAASLPNGRRVMVTTSGKGATVTIIDRKGNPVMNRKDFRNVTEAKKWAASPSARGPRILGRYQPSGKRRKAWEMPTDASPGLANIQGKKARPTGTIAKPRGLKPGAIAARKGKSAPTPRKPSPKGAGPRIKGARPAGTVVKPKGLKVGALAARRGAKVKPVKLPKSAAQAVAQANRLLDRLKIQRANNPGGGRIYQVRDRIDQVNRAIKKIVPSYKHNPMRKGSAAKAVLEERNRKYGLHARAWNNIGRLYG